ncbi:hypothetical protein [Aquabacterium sp. J223]|uniref:hypothetical protein n=1 Tax=Aquabacterium sp. J223 TaxID=2898431 RepID=UPI0021ADEDC0|nr:hypothetical protein [Aquabacterium sp. J223]UUX95464.1 hypothetical protein LRS07_20015 [Aquabacterium sp. J223]
MRLTLLFTLGLLTAAAASAAQNLELCRRDMAAGRCGLQMSGAPAAAGTTAKAPKKHEKIFIAGYGPVPLSAYSALRDVGDGRELCAAARPVCAQNPSGPSCLAARQKCPKVAPDMCDVAEQAVRTDPEGDTARVARALWPG